LRPFIENWESVAARIIQRVHREAAANPSDEAMKRFLKELLSYPDVPSRWRTFDLDEAPPPFLTINYRWKNTTLRLFSAPPPLARRRTLHCRNCALRAVFRQMRPRALP
jgi:MmyB-like transcription regulator ligand binding domain